MSSGADVLFVSGTLEVGGSETKIVRVANALARAGYATGIAYFNPPDTLLGQIHPDVTVTHLERRGKFSFHSLRKLRELVSTGYRVVASVNFYPLLYVVPIVRLLARGESRAVGLVNTTDFIDRQWIHGYIYAPFLRRCDRVVYGCHAQQALWTRKYNLPEQRSTYIYNGVDPDTYAPMPRAPSSAFRQELGIPEEAILIGSLGRFAPEKNFDLLIEAVAKLNAAGRSAWLVIVGQGGQREKLAETAALHGLSDKVVFPGIMRDIRPAIAAMDVFVLPSRSETFSNAALEAMSMARPVVLSNVGGAAEMVQHEESGYLFEAGDVETLIDLLATLYDSEDLRERMGAAARQRVLEHFEFAAMLERYKGLIENRPV